MYDPFLTRSAPALAGRIISAPHSLPASLRDRVFAWIETRDIAPDLRADIGSMRWFKRLGVFASLILAALSFWPDFPLPEANIPAFHSNDALSGGYHSQTALPPAAGIDGGGPADNFSRPLVKAADQPKIQMLVTLNTHDSFKRTLLEAGVGHEDAQQAVSLIQTAMELDDIEPGTQIGITLGYGSSVGAPYSLEGLRFRARFDLELAVTQPGPRTDLIMSRKAIHTDDTPLRIRGVVGDGLYRSARAAGAPASAVQAYLKIVSQQVSVDQLRSTDIFDIIISYRRAATGERQIGQVLYAGLERGTQASIQLMRWGKEGRFYEASGVGAQRDGMIAPVPGRISSGYGMRRHPILGYRRMHAGIDFRAQHGTPIVAVTDGQVTGARRMGGCGRAVRLQHDGGIDTRYCHMSRIAVNKGQMVKRGQIIGYVGSTGLSTGPHLHYETYRNGRMINPSKTSFAMHRRISGKELERFHDRLRQIKMVVAGAALADLAPPEDEIDTSGRPKTAR